MYITVVRNRNSPPTVLLRQGWRKGSKTRQRTLANLSHGPKQKIETFRRLLAKYGVPIRQGIPALAVLNPQGKLLYAMAQG
jgi:hypothetical protein